MTGSRVIFFPKASCPGSHPPRIAVPAFRRTVSFIACWFKIRVYYTLLIQRGQLEKERAASNITIPPATATFRLSAWPAMGIFTQVSAMLESFSVSPFPSFPIRNAAQYQGGLCRPLELCHVFRPFQGRSP